MIEVIALGAIAEIIFTFIRVILNSTIEQVTRFFYLITYFGQIDKPKGCAMFLDKVFQ
jgi:hypothetical protein